MPGIQCIKNDISFHLYEKMNYIYLWDFFKLEIRSYSMIGKGFEALKFDFFFIALNRIAPIYI